MVFVLKRAIGALMIAAVLSTTLLGVGCGGGDDGSERAVEWTLERVIGPKTARLVAPVDICRDPVRLEEPIIEYEDDRAYVEIRHTPEKNEGDNGGCLLNLWVLHKTVAFEQDLDELTIFDSSTDPPQRRWPRERPRPGK
ncbi:MAG: hypothetical protein WA862_07120 [Solirubrobacterales bacterium]